MHPFLWSLVGGLLVGVAAWIMVAGLGRIAGISGIAATAMFSPRESGWRFAFLIGLIVGGALIAHAFDRVAPAVTSKTWLVVAGLLVGVGTVLGSGCTSGHGVCGLARFSIRSLISVVSFMIVGAITVAIIRYTGGAA
jgi:uncharacterized protein